MRGRREQWPLVSGWGDQSGGLKRYRLCFKDAVKKTAAW